MEAKTLLQKIYEFESGVIQTGHDSERTFYGPRFVNIIIMTPSNFQDLQRDDQYRRTNYCDSYKIQFRGIKVIRSRDIVEHEVILIDQRTATNT